MSTITTPDGTEIDYTSSAVVLEPAAQDLADATSKPPFLYELGYAARPQGPRRPPGRTGRQAPVDEEWITVPAAVGDARVRIIKPPAADGRAARDRLHARRRLGARQRWHPRPPRARTGRRREGRAGLRRVPQLARGAATPSRSSRATRPPSGSPGRVRRRGSMPPGWRSRASRSAAT